MRFIPDYRVCYKGEFYECGEELEIDPADAEEMSEHGEVMEATMPPVSHEPPERPDEPVEEKPRRGRPAKKEGLE